MYSKQTGCLPQVTFFGGFVIIAYMFMAAINGILVSIGDDQTPIWITAIIIAVIAIPFLFPGLLLTSMFPSIRIMDKGIKYKYLMSTGKIIVWDEIDEIVDVAKPKILKGTKAVVIRRKGYTLINRKGLFLQSYHGILIGSDLPVLLLSSSLGNLEGNVDQIKEYMREST